jgi:hypothetical protein
VKLNLGILTLFIFLLSLSSHAQTIYEIDDAGGTAGDLVSTAVMFGEIPEDSTIIRNSFMSDFLYVPASRDPKYDNMLQRLFGAGLRVGDFATVDSRAIEAGGRFVMVTSRTPDTRLLLKNLG